MAITTIRNMSTQFMTIEIVPTRTIQSVGLFLTNEISEYFANKWAINRPQLTSPSSLTKISSDGDCMTYFINEINVSEINVRR